MKLKRAFLAALFGALTSSGYTAALAQPPPDFGGPPGGFRPGGRGMGPMSQERKLVKQFDKNGDKRLNREERQAAREALKQERANGGGRGFGGPPGGGFGGPGGFRPGGPGGFGGRGNQEAPKSGVSVSPGDVKNYPDAELYDTKTLRTLFLEFENKDWETELSDFHGTDVEVPATVTVDGKKYPDVGIHFRGMSSYRMISPGYKRSLNLSFDYADEKQRLHGYKTLNLLNAHEDASFMGTVLYSQIARQVIPAPKANFVKVVINGENWGIYTNVQQFDKIFLNENYKTDKGIRWKVSGSPGGDGGLNYVGENIAEYKRRYEIKTGDDDKSWKALIHLCKTLSETPTDKLEEALKPILDIDSALWFLALDVALINGDGYWVRASDYSIFLDEKGKFHIQPHDMNEAFRAAGGPGGGPPGGPRGFGGPGGFPGGPGGFPPGGPGGFPPEGAGGFPGGPGGPPPGGVEGRGAFPQGGPGGFPPNGAGGQEGFRPGGRGGQQGFPPGGFAGPGGQGRQGRPGMMGRGAGIELDPLVGMEDTRKPLRSRLLAVPALKERYLQHVRTIAEQSLDWKKLGPVVAQYRAMLDKEIKADTRKLESYEEFLKVTADTVAPAEATPGRRPGMTGLRAFADQRRKYLLNYSPNKKATSESASAIASGKAGK